LIKRPVLPAQKDSPETHDEIDFLMGTCTGEIYHFDPILRSRSSINKFNSEENCPIRKKK
jgi:hypothetical protein